MAIGRRIVCRSRGATTATKLTPGEPRVATRNTAFWTPPPAVPGSPAFLFNGTIYYRGAMTLQALRQKVGDLDFFALMRAWATRLYRPEKPVSW